MFDCSELIIFWKGNTSPWFMQKHKEFMNNSHRFWMCCSGKWIQRQRKQLNFRCAENMLVMCLDILFIVSTSFIQILVRYVDESSKFSWENTHLPLRSRMQFVSNSVPFVPIRIKLWLNLFVSWSSSDSSRSKSIDIDPIFLFVFLYVLPQYSLIFFRSIKPLTIYLE